MKHIKYTIVGLLILIIIGIADRIGMLFGAKAEDAAPIGILILMVIELFLAYIIGKEIYNVLKK